MFIHWHFKIQFKIITILAYIYITTKNLGKAQTEYHGTQFMTNNNTQ